MGVAAVLPMAQGPETRTVVLAECSGKLVLVGHVGGAWAEIGRSASPTILGRSLSGGGGWLSCYFDSR